MSARFAPPRADADVCLIVEGCYPYVAGGVSTWLDWLMRSQPETRFEVAAIVAAGQPRVAKYAYPENLAGLAEIELGGSLPAAGHAAGHVDGDTTGRLAPLLADFLTKGRLGDFRAINDIVNDPLRPLSLPVLLRSRLTWDLCCANYESLMPHGSFKGFFWAWHALMGGLFAVLKAPLPQAVIYHAISTGYAGLLAARATLEGAARAIVTEHGIYTTERRIEVLMAPWIVDLIDKGEGLGDDRMDLRDLWVTAFESYARCCYEACDFITTLFDANQPMQRELGAGEGKLRVVANGIELARFAHVKPRPTGHAPVVALIGRVVPIKDIKTFIRAVALARHAVPDLKAVIAGPMDEDPAYAAECLALVRELHLGEHLSFPGRVDVTALLHEVDIVVLTSLSEAQPLSILEAGAAGRPCLSTDVGSCRELIEGCASETPRHGPGGIVTGIGRVEDMAEAIGRLAGDPALRGAMGANLKARVSNLYTSQRAAARYRALYRDHEPLRGAG